MLFRSILGAGLDGIERKLKSPKPVVGNFYEGPEEATPGMPRLMPSENSFERRKRTRKAESSTVVSEPVPGVGHGFGNSSSTPGHSLSPLGGAGDASFGLKSDLAYAPLPRCGSVHTMSCTAYSLPSAVCGLSV